MLDSAKIFGRVERLGLRYINFFENHNVVQHSTLKIEVAERSIADQSITLRTEHPEKGFTVVTQISSTASIEGSPAKTGSIIDIDVSTTEINLGSGSLPDRVIEAFVVANAIADDTFFALLKGDFIDQFEPEY